MGVGISIKHTVELAETHSLGILDISGIRFLNIVDFISLLVREYLPVNTT